MAQVNCDALSFVERELDRESVLKPPSSKKPRRNRRLDILNARRTIAELEIHLQILNEKYEFCESVRAPKSSSCGLDWRLVASRERLEIKKASRANENLKKRVSDNTQLIQRVSRLMDRQGVETMPMSVQVDSRISGLDNEAHVYRVLQACLDFRSKRQVESIVNQCNATPSTLERNDWNTFVLENNGIGVGFRESALVPCSAAFIGATSCWSPSGLFNHPPTDHPRKATCYNEFGQRLTLQRQVHLRSRAIMLWEDAFCWQESPSSPRAIVRGSGWVLIAPVSGHEHDLSITHSGGFVLIHATDRSLLQATDAVVESIVAYAQMQQRARIRSLEDALIDTLRQSE